MSKQIPALGVARLTPPGPRGPPRIIGQVLVGRGAAFFFEPCLVQLGHVPLRSPLPGHRRMNRSCAGQPERPYHGVRIGSTNASEFAISAFVRRHSAPSSRRCMAAITRSTAIRWRDEAAPAEASPSSLGSPFMPEFYGRRPAHQPPPYVRVVSAVGSTRRAPQLPSSRTATPAQQAGADEGEERQR
jgi:hypothetical protein